MWDGVNVERWSLSGSHNRYWDHLSEYTAFLVEQSFYYDTRHKWKLAFTKGKYLMHTKGGFIGILFPRIVNIFAHLQTTYEDGDYNNKNNWPLYWTLELPNVVMCLILFDPQKTLWVR